MTSILAIDTSTEACSCAILTPEGVQETYAVIPRQHAAQVLPMIDQLMKKLAMGYADLDAIAFGRGPGSFTGLRIAAGVAQGLGFASGKPLVPVSTLAALAWQIQQKTGCKHVLSMLDARIDEVYWGLFDYSSASVLPVSGEYLTPPEAVLSDAALPWEPDSLTCVGTGLGYAGRMPFLARIQDSARFPDELPAARAIAVLAASQFSKGEMVPAMLGQPVYLRDQVAKKPGERNGQ